MKRILIAVFGFHGKRHKIRERRIEKFANTKLGKELVKDI